MLVNKSRGLKKELINTLIKGAASAQPIFTTAIYPGKGKAFSSRVVSSKDWELESGGRRPFLCCNCPNAHSPHQLLSHKLRPPQLDNLNLMARFEGFRVIGRLGRLPGKPIRPHFLLHQLICNASRLVTFIFDIHWVKQNKVSSWLRNKNWSQNMAICVRFVLFFEPLYCGFWSNRTLPYFPLSSVRPFVLRHRRDILTFLDILTVYTMKTIYFLNAYHLGW